jgi:hypothetical protein
MLAKCPYCANSTPIQTEPSADAPGAPLVARCGHCRRILGVVPDVEHLARALESLRAEVAALRQAAGKG